MPLIIFEPVIDSFRQLEETDLTRFTEPPQLGSTVAIGGERRWLVVNVETYQKQDRTVYLAFITPEGLDSPDLSEWTATTLKRDYPDLSLDLELWQKNVLGQGWNVDGTAPTGRLYEYRQVGDTDNAHRIERPWAIDIIETYKPVGGKASYTAVHLCHCEPVSLPELAIA